MGFKVRKIHLIQKHGGAYFSGMGLDPKFLRKTFCTGGEEVIRKIPKAKSIPTRSSDL